MSLAIGTKLGRYEIRAKIGEGGMGEVYLARDTELDRTVAIKILPESLASDQQRLQRFIQEAKAASALNHPHILTIHEIGTTGNSRFIASEFIDGETLRQRIRAGMRLAEVLDTGIQVSDAITAAHAAGIIHRDIKPENIMVRFDGYIKVLDFGLAKLTDHPLADSAASTLIGTDPGMIIGTAQYMSPEQARGLDTDPRTDIWSLGVVLYEMITGRAPFEGATKSDIIASILEREPQPLISHLPELPAELSRIVKKALRKDREERYQTIKDLGLDLKNLRREMELKAELEYSSEPAPVSGTPTISGRLSTLPASASGTVEGPHPTSSAEYIAKEIKRHKIGFVVVGGLAILALAAVVFGIYKYATRPSPSSPSMKLTKLTSSGNVGMGAISPDGRYVVHVINNAEGGSLWMRQVATSSSLRIIPPGEKRLMGATFSPDGNYIYYAAAEKNSFSYTLYQIPTLGGASKKLIDDLVTPVTLSPNGNQATFIRSEPTKGEESLIISNLDGTGEQKLITRRPPDYFVTYEGPPAWSPDGKTIAYAGYTGGQQYEMKIWEVNLADEKERPVSSSQKWDWIDWIAWTRDGSTLLVNGYASEGLQIWQLSRGGEAHRITNDLNEYWGIDLTADSSTIVTTQSNRMSNLWIAPAGDADRATQITSGTNLFEYVDWTADGKLIFQSSGQIWTVDATGGGQKPLTSEGRNYAASACPGGYIVFSSDRGAGRVDRIWRMNVDGSDQKELTKGEMGTFPTCSSDGKWVLYEKTSTPVPTIWKVPIDGGAEVQLTDKFSIRPIVSPDGNLIALRYLNDPASRKFGMALVPFEGGEPVKLLDIRAFFVRWSRDGRALQYIDNAGGSSNLWSQPLDGSARKQLTNFKSDKLYSFAWSADGNQLAVCRGSENHDIVLISNFR